MSDFPFLDYKLPMYEAHVVGWKRDEARLYGGDAVLSQLVQWKGESGPFYAARQAQSGYLTLPKQHASTLAGHLSKQTPMPTFGALGEVREREERGTEPSLAELFWYNVDGVGQDGTEMPAFFDGVQERAIATGYRWLMVEAPTLSMLGELRLMRGRNLAGPAVTDEDVVDGYRPYLVEYSPISVPYWQVTSGRLDFAVIRTPITTGALLDNMGAPKSVEDGYYLLVRQGFLGLGPAWKDGGWWKFDPDQKLIPGGHGRWDKTRGQVPFFPFIGEASPGTTERPAMARSLTMELGQIAVSLMNRMSERNYNIMQAAKSINHVLGIDTASHGEAVRQLEDGSIMVGYPPIMYQDGSVGIPQIWNSSAALLDSQAFIAVIESGLQEAREIMVRQVTSMPDNSGESKKAGFAEATSPLLARLAATRQQAWNTSLHFLCLRAGKEPDASVTIPRDFDLQPVVDDIDAMLSRLKRSWLRSPLWEKHLLLRAGDEEGMLPEDAVERDAIEAELEASATPTEPMDVLADDEEQIPGRRAPQPVGGLGNGGQP